MDIIILFFENLLTLANDASPWLLLGLVIAGLMKAWLPSKILSRHLGTGKLAIIKAALIGAPLPLCSCGVIPVAAELRRSGASASATSSFLVATPETGVDSVSVSYALLGPVFAIYRPVSAILSAIITGFLVATTKHTQSVTNKQPSSCCASQVQAHCGDSKTINQPSILKATLNGLQYAASQLIDDLKLWLLLGLIFATIVKTFVPESFLIQYGSGIVTMLLMMVISIPMYICATASTPVAAGFLMAGISPGTTLVFMMTGPATNISTLGVIKKEMGAPVLIRYLIGIACCAISFGIMLDWLIMALSIDIHQQIAHSHELLPNWFSFTCTGLLIFLSLPR